MSYPFGRLTFDSLIKYTHTVFDALPDYRVGPTTYTMADAAFGAFSMFYFQCPSFLDFQRKMSETQGRSNAQSLLGIETVMRSNQIRNILDEVDSCELNPIYDYVLRELYDSKHLEGYRGINNNLYIAIDGIQSISSQDISCEQCRITNHKNGTITYSHSMISPAIVSPGNPHVIPLWPEHMKPQDGHNKQDCENAAAKRWLIQHAEKLSLMGVTVLGDDLYAKQPLVEAILEAGLNFILVCKPTSHEKLYEWVDELEKCSALATFESRYTEGKFSYIRKYRFNNEVRLKADNTLSVNWCELIIERDDGKVTYKNTWVTNHWITEENIEEIAEGGRTRWKIENENNGTLKTRGYHLEHNFGHGSKYLSETLLTLNILAFLFHTVMNIQDQKYILIREKLPRKTFFEHIKALTYYMYFDSWDSMLDFMMKGLELKLSETA